MNIRLVFNTLGSLLLLIGGCMLIPLALAWEEDGIDFIPFLISFGITLSFGLFFKFGLKSENKKFSYREAFSISVFAWLLSASFSALPMFISDYYGYQSFFNGEDQQPHFMNSLINSLFESMSGYTGTAATVIRDIEVMPRALLFWRCFHNWLGGMGIIVLFVAILPSLGTAGSKLFKSESTFSVTDSSNVYPKIRDMAKALWLVYLSMSIVLAVLLYFCGMNIYDSVCHTFSTMATGGFSTKNSSITHFNNLPIEITLIVFMFICGTNFMLVRFMVFGKWKALIKNIEFQVYASVICFAIASASVVNFLNQDTLGYFSVLREVAFNVVSLGTSTGLGLGDYDSWPAYSKIVLFCLMLMGGCGGSTAGGFKVIRAVLFFKWIQREFKRMVSPHGVFPIIVQGESIDQKTADGAIGFVILYILTIIGFGALVSIFENDVLTAFSGTIACLSNMGPGFGFVGPTDNFFNLSLISKFLLTTCMLIGRLELLAFYILFLPKMWKK